MPEKIDDYFIQTLKQLMHHPDEDISTSAIELGLEFTQYSLENLTLAEILEHENRSIQAFSTNRLLQNIWKYLRHQEIITKPLLP